MEPLLRLDDDRFILFPIKRPDIWKVYKDMLASVWTNEEIDYAQDIVDWNTKLNADERHFISLVLAFFASSDSIVLENVCNRFSSEVAYAEARMVYATQQFFEAIHAEGYAIIIDTLVKSKDEKDRLFRAIQTIPAVEKKARWVLKWIGCDEDFATRLVAFAIVEGVLFSASFCAIFWVKTRGLMPGLAALNTLIARDEGMHADFAALLYTKYIEFKLPQAKVHEMLRDAVAIETEFIAEALDVRVIGMNAALMTEYVQYVADHLLETLGYEKIWHARMVFDFMNNISVTGKANFFETRVCEYQLGAVAGGDKQFTTESDF